MKRLIIIQVDRKGHEYATLKVNYFEKILRGYEITENETVVELSADEVIHIINEK